MIYRFCSILTSLLIFNQYCNDLWAEKSDYNILNPVPKASMRELSTDRPDTTESPYTVDAGHVQLELSFLNYTKVNGVEKFEEYSLMPFNFKIGLFNNTDIQFVADPYIRHIENKSDVDGFGNTQIRLKSNLWGNDEGDTALALMPYIQFPSGNGSLSNDNIEWGLIVPLALSLPYDFNLGFMAEVDFIRDDEDTEFNSTFIHTATLGHNVYGDLDGYIEYVGISSDDNEKYQAVFNLGGTYSFSENIQFDTGAGFGLNDSAEDLTVFIGISLRE